ncbi:MAG: hypothetical protein NPIRA02_25490 [Nitrospirales bacterium]|nr:MAG: hypothetical protein NPIRA02_25490 [Nitrospirales bacterium]
MPLDATDGEKALQLITSRYNQREWRKKIEKMLSLPPSGLNDDVQRKVFLYLKLGLQAYKSRRADAPSWIVGGFATKEVIDRARFKPAVIDEALSAEDVKLLGVDPGEDVNEVWWDEMLIRWHINPEDEVFEEMPEADAENTESGESGDETRASDETETSRSVSADS